jgi:hypothetical protein
VNGGVFDPGWQNFHRWMRDAKGNAVETGWTSVAFVPDTKGVVQHIHPAGSFVEGGPAYAKLITVVEQLLAAN